MGLTDELRGATPAEVTWAQARRVWSFGVMCEEAAVEKGSHWYGDDPLQQTRLNNLARLKAWEGTFASYNDDTPMDPGNWDALRQQVWGAAADLEAMGEVDDSFYRRLSSLWDDIKTEADNVAKVATIGLGAVALIVVGVLFLSREIRA